MTRHDNLTTAQRHIIRLLAQGYNDDEIALALGISPFSVRSRVYTIMNKLGAYNRRNLVAIAAQKGIITLKEPAK